MKIHGRHYRTFEPIAVQIDGQRIRRVESAWAKDMAAWPLIAPALFDLQINGHGGTWFGGAMDHFTGRRRQNG